jgi:hypothetical protein
LLGQKRNKVSRKSTRAKTVLDVEARGCSIGQVGEMTRSRPGDGNGPGYYKANVSQLDFAINLRNMPKITDFVAEKQWTTKHSK